MSGNLRGIKAYRARSYRELEGIARHVREVLEIDPEGPMNALGLFERLSSITVRVGDKSLPLCDEVETVHDGVEAVTYYDDVRDTIFVCISEPWYSKLERGHVRANFTVCHELSHGVLHPNELIDMAQIPHMAAGLRRQGGGPKHQAFFDTEWQANALASAMLMPARAVAGIIRESGGTLGAAFEVSSRFNVSDQSARIRVDVVTRQFGDLLKGGGR